MTQRECECGNVKSANAAACKRCAFLDGKRVREQAVIGYLRHEVRATLREITEALPPELQPRYRGCMWRSLSQLVDNGRVRRDTGDGDATYTLIEREELRP